MRLTDEVSRGAWLQERVGSWATVAGVAGAGFDRYARVLHPIPVDRRDLTRTNTWGMNPILQEGTWPWGEVARRNGKVMHSLVQWIRISEQESALEYPDGWRAGQSRTGWFDPVLMASLTTHLRAATTCPDEVTIGIWDGWGVAVDAVAYAAIEPVSAEDADADRHKRRAAAEQQRRSAYSSEYLQARAGGDLLAMPGREYVLFSTSLAELADPDWGVEAGIGWQAGFGHDPSPQLVWPEDHAWVVATEVDWDSTIVAGTSNLIDVVLDDPRFESYELSGDDRLTFDSDTLNH